MEIVSHPRWKSVALCTLGCIAIVLGCRNKRTGDGTSATPAVASASSENTAPAPASGAPSREIRLLDMLPTCDIDHGGLMVDLGVSTSAVSRAYDIGSTDTDEEPAIDRSGSTFLPIKERRFRRDFWLDEPTDAFAVRARVAGRNATGISLWIDGRRLGRAKVQRNEVSVLTYPRYPDHLEAGRHSLMLEAHGRVANPPEPWFEIDWLQLRRGVNEENGDAAPTLRDIVADQEIDGVPRRSIVLRAASTVRCPFYFSGQTKLDLALGFWGTGRGTAEIRLIEEGQSPTTLHERRIAGGNGARWTPISLDLSSYAGRVVALELRAISASQGGRVVFGEPVLSRTVQATSPPVKAKTVVVVLAAGLERRLVPPWGPIADRGALAELRRDAMAFDSYHTPTTIPAGIVATLLTGASPMVHRVEDTAARLGHSIRMVNEIIKQAGGRTAMFTGVPTTFAAFGFNAGWDDYGASSPVLDLPAETPIIEASRWLARELDSNRGPIRFLFVHARGAHPPWDLTKEQTAQLEPTDYGGSLDARRAGIMLGRIRRQTARVQRRLGDEDVVRLRAMMGAAFSHQVAAVGQLIEALKRRNAWEDTLFVFAGDTANGDAGSLPFDPSGPLREEQLTVPLLVKFPKQVRAGESFAGMVTTSDITKTILNLLDLKAGEPVEGRDLLDTVAGNESPQARVVVATLGRRYVSRTGVWLLGGELGRAPRLCQTDVDPACVSDQFGQLPLTARSLWQWTATELLRLGRSGRQAQREPASIDPETAAALTVWGDVEM